MLPVVVPTHYVYDGAHTVLLHLARPNPVWEALDELPRALLTVVADYVYVPAGLNQGPTGAPGRGVPTSYYATAQADCDVEVLDDPADKMAVLNRQLRESEPVGDARLPVNLADPTDARQLPGIRAVRLSIRDVRAKFKYGGNKTREHRMQIATALAARGGPRDEAARGRLLDRLDHD